MATPYTLGDTMRDHDTAVWKWLGGLLIDYNEIAGVARNQFPILRVVATPHQAFAKVVDMLAHQGFLPAGTAEEMKASGELKWNDLPLPVATIERSDPIPEASRNSSALVRRIYLNPLTGQWETHRWPAQYTTQYRITFWSLRKSTDNYIREWVYGKMGGQGKATHEDIIPVSHPPPWGETIQKFRLDGSTDLSVLEGDVQRFIRTEFAFTLRTLVFFPPVGNGYITHGVGFTGELIGSAYGDTTTDGTVASGDSPSAVPAVMTGNLFYYPVTANLIPTEWPVTGNGKASAGLVAPGGVQAGPEASSLRAQVTLTTDSVEVLERLAQKDPDGRAIVSVSLRYQSAGAQVDLEVAQRDGSTNALTLAFEARLPVVPNRWDPVHVFALVKGDTFQVNLVGTGTAGEATVADVDIRQVYDGTRVAPAASSTPGPGLTRHEWGSLDNAPYLVILALAPSNPAGPSTVTVQDDLVSPSYTKSQPLDPSANVGLVFLVQPKAGYLGLTLPSALALDTVYVQRYPGAYNGSTI